ncbi:UNVERIFIED_CONTAM: protein RER1C [Sesamum latifolium]|uniref:Protein RER1C n=1 Tax=Sesamum latifolium TaxID=2727402 RepID=A0AAW2Y7W4_9LAMI
MESAANGSTSPTDVPTAKTAAEDLSSSPSAAAVSQWTFAISQRFQHFLDKSTPFLLYRWIAFLCIAFCYVVRVYLVQGFYVVSYALGIYILNLLIGFLSPQVDPEFSDSPTLPVRRSDEFRPFVRRLPEFKFWYSITKAFCIAFVLTFFNIFDVPVYWPILLFYWIVLCMLTLRRQIQHMINDMMERENLLRRAKACSRSLKFTGKTFELGASLFGFRYRVSFVQNEERLRRPVDDLSQRTLDTS